MKFVHVPGKKNVADYLSRIPGAEKLPEEDLCADHITLGICHLCEVPDPRRLVKLSLRCPSCGEYHIDEGKYATFNHRVHVCSSCGVKFSSQQKCIGLAPPDAPEAATEEFSRRVKKINNIITVNDDSTLMRTLRSE